VRLAVEVELQHEVGGELVDCLVDAKLLERAVESGEGGDTAQQPHVDR